MGVFKALTVATLLYAASAAAQVTVTVTQMGPSPEPSAGPSPESSPQPSQVESSQTSPTSAGPIVITSNSLQPLSSPLTCYGTTLSTLDQDLCCPGRFVSTPGPLAYCCIGILDTPLSAFSAPCAAPECALTTAPIPNPADQVCMATIAVTDPNYSLTVQGYGAFSSRPMSTAAPETEPSGSTQTAAGSSSGVPGVTILGGASASSSTAASTSSSSGIAAQVTSGPLAGAVVMIAGGLIAVL